MAGNQGKTELDPNIMAFDLGKELEALQRHIKKLRLLNYIDVVRIHRDGRFAENRYYLNFAPDEALAQLAIGCEVVQDLQKQDTQKAEKKAAGMQDPQNQDTQKQDTVKQDTQKQDATRNSNYHLTVLQETDTTSMIDRWIAWVQEKIHYAILKYQYQDECELAALDTLVGAVAKVFATNEPRIILNGQPVLTASARERFEGLSNQAAVNVLARFLARHDSVSSEHMGAYLLTSLHNELLLSSPGLED